MFLMECRLKFDPGVEIPKFSYSKSGWLNGEGIMRITPSQAEGIKMPWKYQIIFTDDDSAYVGVASSGTVRDELGSSISPRKIMQPALNFIFKISPLLTHLVIMILWMWLFMM